jgi:hypothetical protein
MALSIYIKKRYLKAKEELWKLKYFHQYTTNIIFQKNPLKKRNQNPSRYYYYYYYNSIITNLSSFNTQAKSIIFQKNPHIIFFLKPIIIIT